MRHLLRSEYDRRKFEAVLTFLEWITDLPRDVVTAIDAEIAAKVSP